MEIRKTQGKTVKLDPYKYVNDKRFGKNTNMLQGFYLYLKKKNNHGLMYAQYRKNCVCVERRNNNVSKKLDKK